MSEGRPAVDRRQHERKENRAEMYLGANCSAVSNLSMNGAYVSILSGLHTDDTFSFELALDEKAEGVVSGQAVVVWTDPGVGVGVRFVLSEEQQRRLAGHLEELNSGERPSGLAFAQPPDTGKFDPPRRTRRTVAVGPSKDGGDSKVWFRYFPPDKAT